MIIVLLMLASALAGCTGGDPEGEEIDLGISDEIIEQLQTQLDENLTKISNLENISHTHSSNQSSNTPNDNMLPLVYMGPNWGAGECDNGCIIYIGASAIDLDGEVELMGVDINLDGIIDQNLSSPFVESWGDNNEISFEVNYSIMTMYSIVLDSQIVEDIANRGGYDGCIMRLNIIAVDNQGDSSISPQTWSDDCYGI